ncbi:MAG: alpha/beta hydrolase [Actinobacteria bacterium]|nr:alpha/beta hydrolase [Actinomycetota bacterium]
MSSITADQSSADSDQLVVVAQYGTPGRAAWLDINWRAHLRQDRLAGQTVNFVQYGDPAAPAVVLIHGLAGCWQNWLENIPALGEDFNVIAIDLPGFGESAMPAGKAISIPGYARTVVGVLNSLGVERASLIGNSMGGQTAIQTALDHPTRVDRTILVSPAGYSTCVTPPALGHCSGLGGALIANEAPWRRFLISRPRLRAIALGSVVAHPELLGPEICFELMGADRKVGFAAAAHAILDHDFRSNLRDVASPTLVVWGRNDHLVTYRDAERLASRIPNAQKIVLRDTGHCTMVERPIWFNKTARDFLLSA